MSKYLVLKIALLSFASFAQTNARYLGSSHEGKAIVEQMNVLMTAYWEEEVYMGTANLDASTISPENLSEIRKKRCSFGRQIIARGDRLIFESEYSQSRLESALSKIRIYLEKCQSYETRTVGIYKKPEREKRTEAAATTSLGRAAQGYVEAVRDYSDAVGGLAEEVSKLNHSVGQLLYVFETNDFKNLKSALLNF